ncbi:hypothetical protein NQ317_014284 [Molorchus minor]|uniref:Uncharacterized protein n=1 Tax=Molorchus minor TaxID=1323400 RepID=A0ABQ9IU71_9CUCU|nr:hypothetical protein NQ317_014284 [Molorchus minor]
MSMISRIGFSFSHLPCGAILGKDGERETFFPMFHEVVPPTGNKEPWIIQQFPEKYKDDEVLKSVPKFAYPYRFENEVIQHYCCAYRFRIKVDIWFL